jgi:uncharacterized phage-associated protein
MNEISFCFNAKKAAQAANKLLVLSGGQRNYMELVKLLYLSDREALICLHAPITGDQFSALPYGPVLSRILNLIRFGPVNPKDGPWFDAISPPIGYDVKSLGDCGDDELSGAEEQILSEVFAKFGKMNWKELSVLTHELPEYIDPNGGSLPIPPEHILLLEGKSKEKIEIIRSEVALFACLDNEIAQFEGQEFEVPIEA